MRTGTFDFVGQALSVICMIHCAVTPLVLTLGSMTASVFSQAHPFLFALVLVTAIAAFVPSFRHHQKPLPLILALLGLMLLSIGSFGFHSHPRLEVLFSVAGATVMMAAHIKNRALKMTCDTCAAAEVS